MIPLTQQITDIDTQLDLLVAGDENRVAIKEYEKFFEQFFPVVRKLADSCEKIKVLKNIPNDSLDREVELISHFKNHVVTTKSVLRILAEKWLEDDYTVTQDDSFDNAIQSIKSLTKGMMELNKVAWKAWCDHLLENFNVTDAELASIEKIDRYKDIHNTFVQERMSFELKASNLPVDEVQISELESMSNRLQELIKDIDFNIPVEVKLFFDHLNSPIYGKKAALSLLTPEVMKWIEDNNEIGSFSITRTVGNR